MTIKKRNTERVTKVITFLGGNKNDYRFQKVRTINNKTVFHQKNILNRQSCFKLDKHTYKYGISTKDYPSKTAPSL